MDRVRSSTDFRAQVVAADIAPGMLERAKRQSRWLRRFARVRADAYSLPFRDGAFELVFSSLMLQWCDDLDAVFAEIARVLRPVACCCSAPLARAHWPNCARRGHASDDASNHVNHFFDAHALGSALMQASWRAGAGCRSHRRGYPDAMS